MTQIIYPQGWKIKDWLKREKLKCRLFTRKATFLEASTLHHSGVEDFKKKILKLAISSDKMVY